MLNGFHPDRYGGMSSLSTANSKARQKQILTRAAVVFVCLIGLMWLLIPESRYPADDKVATVSEVEKAPATTPARHDVATSAPDSTTSTHCSKPYPGKPLIQYAIMIDAGSSGSRIHVYRFNNCKGTPELEHEEFKMLEPGLSSYGDDAEGAAKSLDDLLEVAVQHVPRDLQKCTPIAVKATAGLRKLGPQKSEKILKAVRNRLETVYPFPIAKTDGVVVMDGREEGIYAWITVNYLLGNFDDKDSNTAAVFDLGGGSTQIAYEPKFTVANEDLEEGEHKYALDFHGRTYTLYQHSYLGFGLNEARSAIYKYVWDTLNPGEGVPKTATSEPLPHPCLPKNATVIPKDYETMLFSGTATNHAQCRKITDSIMKKDEACSLSPCSFAGVYQPSLTKTFPPGKDIYTFSFFYDVTEPLGMPSEFTLTELRELTSIVCSGEEVYKPYFAHNPKALEALKAKPGFCMDLSYLYSLLHYGYDIPDTRVVKTAKKIKNVETGWCLGASIAMLDEVSVCKA
ncbi:hypothetical protein BZG36_01293 [Bifiguratus adelaidae]|uniref:guanosine-diphosphatase n=1 Tax=Bifiguratus adelaidae TaxID=1938954 RepID=A0A261Y5A4_9FUNG|nr:hypothetical protein BZG36_01293 [Bifiguratus adelaidae]